MSGVNTFSAEVGASGSVGGQSLRGRLLVGLAAPASARIEALRAVRSAGVHLRRARDGDATAAAARRPRPRSMASPDAVLEAIAGVPLDAAALRGAHDRMRRGSLGQAGRSIGDDWRVVPVGADEMYFKRAGAAARWQRSRRFTTPAAPPMGRTPSPGAPKCATFRAACRDQHPRR